MDTVFANPIFCILVHEAEEGETGYWAEVLDLPGCLSQGETLEELYLNVQEAISAVLPLSETSADSAPYSASNWPSATTLTT